MCLLTFTSNLSQLWETKFFFVNFFSGRVFQISCFFLFVQFMDYVMSKDRKPSAFHCFAKGAFVTLFVVLYFVALLQICFSEIFTFVIIFCLALLFLGLFLFCFLKIFLSQLMQFDNQSRIRNSSSEIYFFVKYFYFTSSYQISRILISPAPSGIQLFCQWATQLEDSPFLEQCRYVLFEEQCAW